MYLAEAADGGWSGGGRAGRVEAELQIGEDVLNVLQADRQAHRTGRHAGLGQLLLGQLRVRRRGRMDDQGLGPTPPGQECSKGKWPLAGAWRFSFMCGFGCELALAWSPVRGAAVQSNV